MPTELNPHIFRAYDIRGVAHEQVTVEAAYLIAREFAVIVKEKYKLEHPRIIVGRDCRTHGPELERAVIYGLLAEQCNIETVGVTPSIVNYFMLCSTKADASIQVTASHNDKEDNGLKLNLRNCEPFYDKNIEVLQERIDTNTPMPDLSVEPVSELLTAVDGITPYHDHVAAMFADVGDGKTVVIDAGNGTGGIGYPDILRSCGAKVIELYTELDGTFPNHQPDPSQQHTLKDLQAKVLETGADVGLAFDGDGDRIGCVDNKGNIVIADDIILLLAKDYINRNPNGKVVMTCINSSRLQTCIPKWGGDLVICPVGSANVEHTMVHEHAKIGGEISGHIYITENYYDYGDPLVVSLTLLRILKSSNQTLEQAVAELPSSIRQPELRPHCDDEHKTRIVSELTEHFQQDYDVETMDGMRVTYSPTAWFGIRQSNTSPKLSISFEAQTEDELQAMKAMVKEKLVEYPEVEKVL
jgi:phosphomannomutase/phosphoglucomutase